MIKLVIQRFDNEQEKARFHKLNEDAFKESGAISIENPKSSEELSQLLKKHKNIEAVFVRGHGSFNSYEPTINLFGNAYEPLSQVINSINQNLQDVQQIHVSACFAGAYFGDISAGNSDKKYYQNLEKAMLPNQKVFIHAEANFSPLSESANRLKIFLRSEQAGLSEYILAASNIVQVAQLQQNNYFLFTTKSFKTFEYQPYQYSSGAHAEVYQGVRQYFSDALTKAALFENSATKNQVEISDEKVAEFLNARLIYDSQKNWRRNSGAELDSVKSMIRDCVVDVNYVDSFGWNAVMFAIQSNKELLLAELIKNPAVDLKYIKENGYTPLNLAASENKTKMVKMLLESGRVDVNQAEDDGWTPLAFAVAQGNLAMVQDLVAAGADIEVKDKWGRSITDLAKMHPDPKNINLVEAELKKTQAPKPIVFESDVAGVTIFEQEATLPFNSLSQVSNVSSTTQRNISDLVQGANTTLGMVIGASVAKFVAKKVAAGNKKKAKDSTEDGEGMFR